MSDPAEPHPPAEEATPTASERSSSATPPAGRWWLVVAVGVLVLALDQLTKWWALVALDSGNVIDVGLTLTFRLARNTGAAFSMGSGSGITRFLPLIVLAVVIAVVIRSRSLLTRAGAVALGMILGGAIGNLIDRAFRTDGGGLLSGGVIDFIAFTWWPVFNVADMGVVVGGILFAIVAFLTDEDRQPRAGRTAGSDEVGA